MRKELFLVLAGSVLLGGCGKIPMFSSPTDGQAFVIENVTQIPITMDNNDYSNVTITATGMDQLAPTLTFQPAANGPAAINHVATAVATSSYGTACQTTACVVGLKYTKGNDTREITITFTHSTTGTAAH